MLPGIISFGVYCYLTDNTPESLWRYSLGALISAMIIYIPLEYLDLWAPMFQFRDDSWAMTIAEPKFVVASLVASLLLASIFSLVVRSKAFSSVLVFMRLTDRAPHETAWHSVLDSRKYLRVIRKNGEILLGWPKYYSLTSDHAFIYLQNVYFFEEDEGGFVHLDNADGVLVNYADVDTIEVSNEKLARR